MPYKKKFYKKSRIKESIIKNSVIKKITDPACQFDTLRMCSTQPKGVADPSHTQFQNSL